jgi:hypothetical protein
VVPHEPGGAAEIDRRALRVMLRIFSEEAVTNLGRQI